MSAGARRRDGVLAVGARVGAMLRAMRETDALRRCDTWWARGSGAGEA
jgi:hypothetical protein